MSHPDIERYIRRRLGGTTDADRDVERRKIVRYRPAKPTFTVQSASSGKIHQSPSGINFLVGGVTVDGDIITVPSLGFLGNAGIPTAAAVSTGTVTVGSGSTDEYGSVQIVPTVALAAGAVIRVTFGTPRAVATYIPMLDYASTDARAMTGNVGYTARSLTTWDVAVGSALAAGNTYTFGYHLRG